MHVIADIRIRTRVRSNNQNVSSYIESRGLYPLIMILSRKYLQLSILTLITDSSISLELFLFKKKILRVRTVFIRDYLMHLIIHRNNLIMRCNYITKHIS